MSDKIVKLKPKEPESFAVYVPGSRTPNFIDATRWEVTDGHLLQFYVGEEVVAVFHNWDLFEKLEGTPCSH